MTPQKIELAKTREFGELITDTFIFVRQNLKPLLKAFFVFCGFFLVAIMITQSLQQIKMLDIQRRAITDPDFSRYFDVTGGRFALEAILGAVFMILGYTTMTVTVFSYMSLYKEKGNVAPSTEEVWGYIKYFFLRVFGSVFLIGILLMLGFVLCILPGIWLYPIFGLIFPIMVFENASFGYAFNRSFNLISNNWWFTFGALFVMSLIVSVGAMAFSIPSVIVTVINLLLHSPGLAKSPPVVAIAASIQSLTMVLYLLPIITLGLCYFNLNEIKEGTGLIDRINRFGDQTDTNLPAEEY